MSYNSKPNKLKQWLTTHLSWISVKHHEAKFLRADAVEVNIEGAVDGHDAVEEGYSLLAGVACTPAMILRTWIRRQTAAFKTQSWRFLHSFLQRTRHTVDQIHEAVAQDRDGGQASGLCVRIETLNHQHPVVQAKTLVALPGAHVHAVFPDHT